MGRRIGGFGYPGPMCSPLQERAEVRTLTSSNAGREQLAPSSKSQRKEHDANPYRIQTSHTLSPENEDEMVNLLPESRIEHNRSRRDYISRKLISTNSQTQRNLSHRDAMPPIQCIMGQEGDSLQKLGWLKSTYCNRPAMMKVRRREKKL